MHWAQYPVTFDEYNHRVFEVVGLEDCRLRKDGYLDIIVNAYNLIAKLQNNGGIDLLLFCMRAGKVDIALLQANYRLFYELVCKKKVPIVLVVTGLEREEEMESWWTRNGQILQRHGIYVDGHACITAFNGTHREHEGLYEESRHLVRELVKQHAHGSHGGRYMEDKELYSIFVRIVKGLLWGNLPPKRDIMTVLSKR